MLAESRWRLALLLVPLVSLVPCNSRAVVSGKHLIVKSNQRYSRRNDGLRVRAAFFNLNSLQPPTLKESLKEPVAFVGGIFAGLLRLDLNEEPLREWVSRTVEAAGLSVEEIERSDGAEAEEMVPQPIERLNDKSGINQCCLLQKFIWYPHIHTSVIGFFIICLLFGLCITFLYLIISILMITCD